MKQSAIGKTATRVAAVLLLGAIAALGGFYYTQRQACLEEAELVRVHWTRLSDEVLFRRIAIAQQFATANSVAALLELEEPALRNPRSAYEDLRDLPLPEVESEYASVSEYVNTQALYEAANRLAPVETTAGISDLGNVMGMSDDQLFRLRPAMNQAIDFMSAVLRLKNASDLVTECSASNVFARISGEQPLIVRVQVRAESNPAAN